MNHKKRAIIVCPGRGCYNKDQLGYLSQWHDDKQDITNIIDSYRVGMSYQEVRKLDAMDRFSPSVHTLGENAAALIYACAISDNSAIDLEKYDICAVTGNSMGWYIALAVAQSLTPQHAIELITTMGAMMGDKLIGGQLIYPVTDAQWQTLPKVRTEVMRTIDDINALKDHELYLSIDLGAFVVIAGNSQGLKRFEQQIAHVDKYPMRLINHGAFHTPMLNDIANKAQRQLPTDYFQVPKIPLIDGTGKIWSPYSSSTSALHHYTLQNQVCDPYYFNRAIDVAIKEFAPEVFIVLGPGNSLSSSIAQRLIELSWQGISNKEQFIERQKNNPIIIAMGVPEHRQLVTIN